MPAMLAKSDGTELSKDGALTNPLLSPTVHAGDLVARVKPGDVGVFALVIDTVDMERTDYTLPGVLGFAFSLDGEAYGAEGADLYVGTVGDSDVSVWAKAMSAQAGPCLLDLTTGQEGIASIAATGDAPTGTDMGVGANTGTTPINVADAPSGTDAGAGTDGGTDPTAVTVDDAPTGTDTGDGADTGTTPSNVANAPTGTDAGARTDTGTNPTPIAGSSNVPNGTYYPNRNSSVVVTIGGSTDVVIMALASSAPTAHEFDCGVYPTWPLWSLNGNAALPFNAGTEDMRVSNSDVVPTDGKEYRYIATPAGNFGLHPNAAPFAPGATVTVNPVLRYETFIDEETEEEYEMEYLVFGAAGTTVVVS